MVIIDQRDIQKLGGKATKYPASYVVCSMLERHGLNKVLDVTYGRGRFYAYKKPSFLVGADPKVWDWIVKPDIFIPRVVWHVYKALKHLNIEFDVIVCDPPQWVKDVQYNKRDLYSYIIGSSKLIIEEAVKLARKLGVNRFLLHYNTTIPLPIIENVEFIYIARYLHNPKPEKRTHFTLYDLSSPETTHT